MEIGVGTINATTLWYENDGRGELKLYHILSEMRRLKLDIVGVTSTGWLDYGWFDMPYSRRLSYRVIYSGQDEEHKNGVAVILSPRAQRYFQGVRYKYEGEALDGRVMSVLIGDTRIIVMLAPKDFSERKAFSRSDVFGKVMERYSDNLIVMGEFHELGSGLDLIPLCRSSKHMLTSSNAFYSENIMLRPKAKQLDGPSVVYKTLVSTEYQRIVTIKWRLRDIILSMQRSPFTSKLTQQGRLKVKDKIQQYEKKYQQRDDQLETITQQLWRSLKKVNFEVEEGSPEPSQYRYGYHDMETLLNRSLTQIQLY